MVKKKHKKFFLNPWTAIGLAIVIGLILMLLGFSISSIGSIGTFIAALIAAGTLWEIRRQRIAAQKPRLVFNNKAHGNLNWNQDKNGINSNISFDMINAGRDIATNIQINYNWNVNEFLSVISILDKNKESPFTLEKGDITMSLESYPQKKYKFDKLFINIKLEYLLPMALSKKPSNLGVPNDFLAFVSFLVYLIEKQKKDFSVVGVPTVHVKIMFEDISGNPYNAYRSIFVTYTKSSGVNFYMAPSDKNKYDKANILKSFYDQNRKN